jgi:hypothetical protein
MSSANAAGWGWCRASTTKTATRAVLREDIPWPKLPICAAGIFSRSLVQNQWAGAAVELRHGDQTEIGYGPDLRFTIDPARGEIFTLRVIGLPKNLWGPWHIAAKPRKRAWSIFWRHDAISIDTPRPGKDYDLLDLGLRIDERTPLTSP